MLVGDLNIAPLETDVWSHKALLSVVSHTPVEVERFGRVMAAGGWIDAMRRIIPPEEKLYHLVELSLARMAAADKGRRLDHVWVSADLDAPYRRHAGRQGSARLGQALRPCAR